MSGGPDALVVGAGVAGSAVALELAARGASVTVLDRPSPPGRATGAAAGMLSPQYEGRANDPLFRLGVESRRVYPAFAERIAELSGVEPAYRAGGMLVASWTEGETREARRSLQRQREAGLRGRVLSPGEARDVHPGASPHAHSHLWLPDEARVDAQRLAEALPGALRSAGVDLREGRRVRAVEAPDREGGGGPAAVRLEGGERLEGGAVVVAAGAWTSGIRGLPGAPEVRPVKGQMVRLSPPSPPDPVILADHAGHYVVPRQDGTVVAGSTMEEAGFDAGTDRAVVSGLVEGARRLAPSLARAELRESWAGLRPVTRDGRPVLGPAPRGPRIFYATGYGRHGILVAPVAGRAVADLILDGGSGVEWEPFRPGRPSLATDRTSGEEA